MALAGFKHIAGKFTGEAEFGPLTVRQFLSDSAALGDMTAEQVQVDAFRQVAVEIARFVRDTPFLRDEDQSRKPGGRSPVDVSVRREPQDRGPEIGR